MVVVLVKIVLLSIDFTNNIQLNELNETAKKQRTGYASSTHLFELLVHGGGDRVRFLHLVTNHLRHHVSHGHHALYRPAGNKKYSSLEVVIFNAWLSHNMLPTVTIPCIKLQEIRNILVLNSQKIVVIIIQHMPVPIHATVTTVTMPCIVLKILRYRLR